MPFSPNYYSHSPSQPPKLPSYLPSCHHRRIILPSIPSSFSFPRQPRREFTALHCLHNELTTHSFSLIGETPLHHTLSHPQDHHELEITLYFIGRHMPNFDFPSTRLTHHLQISSLCDQTLLL
ncbi:unnamed protein product [Sphenostylis stenocarpa]|uniref:Uncharacterized protein n=1 Tax=Sphenostylis stenocarpa TaxID=92480 RepID=A0AA86SVL4_9FABA|nr:unnamed protein product [Sphenostylis stenocarpa]